MAQYRKRQFGKKTSSFILTMMMLSMAFTVISMPSAAAADGDGDGIDDALDDCLFAPGNSTVNYIGCPDDDGDGVPNFIGQQLGDWESTSRELYHSGGDSRAVAWSPDGRYIAGAGGHDNVVDDRSDRCQIEHHHVPTAKLVGNPPRPTRPIRSRVRPRN